MLYCKEISGLLRKSCSIFNKSGHYLQSESSLITRLYGRGTQSSTASECKDIYLTYFLLAPSRNKGSELSTLLKPNICRLSLPATEESVQTTVNVRNKSASLQSICCTPLHVRCVTRNNHSSMAAQGSATIATLLLNSFCG